MEFDYTICSDGARREIHKLDCPCDDCEKNRVIIQRLRDGEVQAQYPEDFKGLTEQECYDLHRKYDELFPQGAIHLHNPQSRFRF